jgi:spermidine/putrescine transport system substrate-binding protein
MPVVGERMTVSRGLRLRPESRHISTRDPAGAPPKPTAEGDSHVARAGIDELVRRIARQEVSRRAFLAGSGLAGVSAFIAACSGGPPSVSGSAVASPTIAAGSPPPLASSAIGPTPVAVTDTEGALALYGFPDYVDGENVKAFERAFKVDALNYDTFTTNDELMTQLSSASATRRDVGTPSTTFVEALVEGGFIEKLDWMKLPNASDIDPQFQDFFRGVKAHLNDYHLPKDWGTTGIALRTKVVREQVTTWKAFFDIAPAYSGRIVVLNSPRDVFAASLKALGFSLNSVDPKELGKARDLLLKLAPHVLALDSDAYDTKLANEEAVMGLVWTGGIDALREQPGAADTAYVVPEDGTLYWMDSWVIFKDPPHPNAAYAWLNFIQQPDIQARETITNRYATANTEAMKLLPRSILDDPTIFAPPSVIGSGLLEGGEDLSANPLRQQIWDEFVAKVAK